LPIGIINWLHKDYYIMQTVIDKFGRVVIPKQVRLHLGLIAGTPLNIEEKDHKVLLEPVEDKTFLIEKDGLLVFSGTATGDLTGAVRSQRDARLNKLGI